MMQNSWCIADTGWPSIHYNVFSCLTCRKQPAKEPMADIQKRLEKAEKYLQKGKQQDALGEYLEILKEFPAHEGARQTAADLCLTLGRNDEAAEMFSALFDKYASSNDSAKAVVQFKKLIKVGNPTVDQKFRFAQFNERSD